jgi:uncharacterized protein (TIGR03437 family)
VLFARTNSGRTFQTADLESWSPATSAAEPPAPQPASPARLPEPGAATVAAPGAAGRIFALGRYLWRSDDGGRTWENLTAYRNDSVVGSSQRSLAVSPGNPGTLILANDYGVWRSTDGGLSWSGLNATLPNLAIERILETPGASGCIRVATDSLGALELPPGGTVWLPTAAPDLEREATAKSQYSALTGAEITAFGSSGDVVYAGSSDGRIWVSVDAGRSFRASWSGGAGPVRRIVADPAEPRVALAAVDGSGPRLLRTTNTGVLWDALDTGLPEGSVRGIAFDRASSAVYAATDKGVFYGTADLENASVPDLRWTALGRLPATPANDVRLDPSANQLYAALDGYGVYAAAAPHRLRNLRVVNAADFSSRAAAPGSLVTVIGSPVQSASGAGLAYPVLAVLGGESQIQVPFDAAGPSVSLALRTAAGAFQRDLAVKPLSPAVFLSRDGAPWIYDADSGQLLDVRNPAHSNGRIQIMATGLGKVQPDWPAGTAAPLENPPAVSAEVRAYLNGAPVQVSRATLAPGYVGFYIVEIQLPAVTNAGVSELYIAADGQESNHVPLIIEP